MDVCVCVCVFFDGALRHGKTWHKHADIDTIHVYACTTHNSGQWWNMCGRREGDIRITSPLKNSKSFYLALQQRQRPPEKKSAATAAFSIFAFSRLVLSAVHPICERHTNNVDVFRKHQSDESLSLSLSLIKWSTVKYYTAPQFVHQSKRSNLTHTHTRRWTSYVWWNHSSDKLLPFRNRTS